MGPWEFNIELPRESGGRMAVQYRTMEGVQWAHCRSILNYRGILVGSWELNIKLQKSGGLIGVQYCIMDGVL